MMLKLTEDQKKKRGRILKEMADQYHSQHSYLKRNEAYIKFCDMIHKDPVKLRIINALATLK